MEEIRNIDFWMIFAVLLGPIISVLIAGFLFRYLDDRKAAGSRKLNVYKTLMATRAQGLSPRHVEALNQIDLEFASKSRDDKLVMKAWREYLDHLGNENMSPENWGTRRMDLLIELLEVMSGVLGYEFDKTYIKNSVYYPKIYGQIEIEQHAIRKGVAEILNGDKDLRMFVTNFPDNKY